MFSGDRYERLGVGVARGADRPPFLFGVFFFGFLLWFFLFQTILVLPDERTELWIIVLLAVQRIV